MKAAMANSYRLYRLRHKRTGEMVILRHVGTSLGEDGGRIFWLCLADDPMQCLMSMSEDEVRQYDGVKLTYWGQCADQTGHLKHWFSALDGPEPCARNEPDQHSGQNIAPVMPERVITGC